MSFRSRGKDRKQTRNEIHVGYCLFSIFLRSLLLCESLKAATEGYTVHQMFHPMPNHYSQSTEDIQCTNCIRMYTKIQLQNKSEADQLNLPILRGSTATHTIGAASWCNSVNAGHAMVLERAADFRT